ncbi:hypothetical protein GGR56DRAFT_553585 [Xylariaceae sp. FL0804]|nr:hypothetical protein GGR56DRAFT_553585 [Xylariaceae sp. FL0804]
MDTQHSYRDLSDEKRWTRPLAENEHSSTTIRIKLNRKADESFEEYEDSDEVSVDGIDPSNSISHSAGRHYSKRRQSKPSPARIGRKPSVFRPNRAPHHTHYGPRPLNPRATIPEHSSRMDWPENNYTTNYTSRFSAPPELSYYPHQPTVTSYGPYSRTNSGPNPFGPPSVPNFGEPSSYGASHYVPQNSIQPHMYYSWPPPPPPTEAHVASRDREHHEAEAAVVNPSLEEIKKELAMLKFENESKREEEKRRELEAKLKHEAELEMEAKFEEMMKAEEARAKERAEAAEKAAEDKVKAIEEMMKAEETRAKERAEAAEKAAEDKVKAVKEAEMAARLALEAEIKAEEERVKREAEAIERGRREALAEIAAARNAEEQRRKQKDEEQSVFREADRRITEKRKQQASEEDKIKQMFCEFRDEMRAELLDSARWARPKPEWKPEGDREQRSQPTAPSTTTPFFENNSHGPSHQSQALPGYASKFQLSPGGYGSNSYGVLHPSLIPVTPGEHHVDANLFLNPNINLPPSSRNYAVQDPGSGGFGYIRPSHPKRPQQPEDATMGQLNEHNSDSATVIFAPTSHTDQSNTRSKPGNRTNVLPQAHGPYLAGGQTVIPFDYGGMTPIRDDWMGPKSGPPVAVLPCIILPVGVAQSPVQWVGGRPDIIYGTGYSQHAGPQHLVYDRR